MTKIELDKSEFAAWLEAIGSDNIVGVRGEPTRCPIARFLTHKTNQGWAVSRDKYSPTWYEYQTDVTPEWAYQFITKIDNQTLADSNVTADEAIYILNQYCSPTPDPTIMDEVYRKELFANELFAFEGELV